MPAPTSYSEATLATFMIVDLAGIATALGWTTASAPILEAVSDVEVALGISDVASSTNVAGLRALAGLYVWRRARGGLASNTRISVDNETIDRQQMWEHADKMVTHYELQAAALGVGGVGAVTIHSIVRSEDPYAVIAATEDAE